MEIIMTIIFLLILIIIFLLYKLSIKKEYNKEIENENIKLFQKNEKLKIEQASLTTLNSSMQSQANHYREIIKQSSIDVETAQEAMKKAMTQYGYYLDREYLAKEEEYDNLMIELENAYDKIQDEKSAEMAIIQKELDTIRSTRASAIEAQIREKEIKDNMAFYCLQPSQNDIDDVHALERVKPNLHQPRILCMLIWSTYFQKPMTALCNNVLGTSIVSGIYKVTNQETGECYIGQAVDVAKRWKDHAKCGLGIDTPQSNKLYKAIQEYGIWNFSWELLEKCSKEELDKKENFYIELYDSKNYGYNSSVGIKKN